MIKLRVYLLYIYLVENVIFIPKSLIKPVQDDIFAKTVHIWLHHTVDDLLVCDSVHTDIPELTVHADSRVLPGIPGIWFQIKNWKIGRR